MLIRQISKKTIGKEIKYIVQAMLITVMLQVWSISAYASNSDIDSLMQIETNRQQMLDSEKFQNEHSILTEMYSEQQMNQVVGLVQSYQNEIITSNNIENNIDSNIDSNIDEEIQAEQGSSQNEQTASVDGQLVDNNQKLENLNQQASYNNVQTSSDNIQSDIENTNIGFNSDEQIDTTQIDYQLNSLIMKVQNQTGLQVSDIYKLYNIAGHKPIYETLNPDISKETTVIGLDVPFDIMGDAQTYKERNSYYYCPDDQIQRPTKYYLPDAAYNVQLTVQKYINKWKSKDRSSDKEYQILQDEVKSKLYFYEAVLDYIGQPSDNLYVLYKQIIDGKIQNGLSVYDTDNTVVDDNGFTKYKFNTWVIDIMHTHGYNDSQISLLEQLLYDDTYILYCTSITDIVADYYYPYTYGEQTIDNWLSVVTQVVGKVRYVWGGGHYRANNIKGISPMWSLFNQYYIDSGHARSSIVPGQHWCPVHGLLEKSNETEDLEVEAVSDVNEADSQATQIENDGTGANQCVGLNGDYFRSVAAYIRSRKKLFDTSLLETGKYNEMINNAGLVNSQIPGHNLDGLDCQGYVGWVYNQITGGQMIDSNARYFIQSNQFKELQISDKLKPGDIFQWQTHIVMIVGPAQQESNCEAYVMIEMSPCYVQFGVAYKSQASALDIQMARQIAYDANILFGGKDCGMQVHAYNIEYETVENEDGIKVQQPRTAMKLGRYSGFTDTSDFYQMTATELIQYTVDKYLHSENEQDEAYLTGLNDYERIGQGVFSIK